MAPSMSPSSLPKLGMVARVYFFPFPFTSLNCTSLDSRVVTKLSLERRHSSSITLLRNEALRADFFALRKIGSVVDSSDTLDDEIELSTLLVVLARTPPPVDLEPPELSERNTSAGNGLNSGFSCRAEVSIGSKTITSSGAVDASKLSAASSGDERSSFFAACKFSNLFVNLTTDARLAEILALLINLSDNKRGCSRKVPNSGLLTLQIFSDGLAPNSSLSSVVEVGSLGLLSNRFLLAETALPKSFGSTLVARTVEVEVSNCFLLAETALPKSLGFTLEVLTVATTFLFIQEVGEFILVVWAFYYNCCNQKKRTETPKKKSSPLVKKIQNNFGSKLIDWR